MVLSTEWSQVEVIDLINDGNGLGFMLVGGRSTGVVIKTIIPGGLAERDGRLQSGDHVLQIGDVNLRGFSSEQVATVLRQAGAQVRLLVARPVEPTSPDYQALASHAPIVPTKMLSNPEELDRQLLQTGYADNLYESSPLSDNYDNQSLSQEIELLPISIVDKNPLPVLASPIITLTLPECDFSLPETETFEVELRKNVYGLGITVAGYVCEQEDISGIFVKSIIDGSAAQISEKIQINDRIIEVDNMSLIGVTNHQAVEILRNTDIAVKLTLERFLRGPRFERLQVALVDNEPRVESPCDSVTTLSWFPCNTEETGNTPVEIEAEQISHTTIDSVIYENNGENTDIENIQEDFTPVTPELKESWNEKLGNDAEIVLAQIHKLSGLGISLEGTVDVENGMELRPHHYIRSILPEGPVGQDGNLKPGDELLQVNEYCLQGLKHTEVVQILKKLPDKVQLVCARGTAPPVINTSQNQEAFEARSILSGNVHNILVKAHSESSLNTSSTATLTDNQRSRSLEQVSDLAMWSDEVTVISIKKGDRGLGFSILDYQDPVDAEGTVIVVRGLVPGGAAESTNLIFPGDRLVSVNDVPLKGANLDRAVGLLKGAPLGVVQLGISKPLGTVVHNSEAKTLT